MWSTGSRHRLVALKSKACWKWQILDCCYWLMVVGPGELCASEKWILVFFWGGGLLPSNKRRWRWLWLVAVPFSLAVLREPQRAAQSIAIHSWRDPIGFEWNKRVRRDRPLCSLIITEVIWQRRLPLLFWFKPDKGVFSSFSCSNSAIIKTSQQDLLLKRTTL